MSETKSAKQWPKDKPKLLKKIALFLGAGYQVVHHFLLTFSIIPFSIGMTPSEVKFNV